MDSLTEVEDRSKTQSALNSLKIHIKLLKNVNVNRRGIKQDKYEAGNNADLTTVFII
jgi:hypothetical protein